jgi:hypothetical protein
MRAWITGSYRNDWREALALYDSNESEDPSVLFDRSLICPLGRAIVARGDVEIGLREYAAGVDWARSIGATTLEAGILSEIAHLHQLFGDPQPAVEVADRCIALAGANGMRHTTDLAMLYRAKAVRRGASSLVAPADDVRHVLDGAVRSGSGARLIYSLNEAAHLLAAAGRFEAAALAGVGSKPVNHWRHNGLDHIPDEAWTSARERVDAERLELSDIGALTLAVLADLEVATTEPAR